MKEIYEERKYQQGYTATDRLMTDKQKSRGEYYSELYHIRRAEIDDAYKEDWDYLQKLYACKRDPVAGDISYPNSFIPLITPCVEGQVASMSEANVDYVHVTNNPGHHSYMRTLDAASEYYRRKIRFKLYSKDLSRFYCLLGNSWIVVSWEKSYSKNKLDPGGYPRVTVPPILSVLVDGRIKDVKDLQYAEYIIHEIGYQSIAWARNEYGDDVADALLQNYNRVEGSEADINHDDTYSFMLLNVWTRSNPENNLQLIQMDANGFVFYESDSSEPYYKYCNNEYPFAMARMIPQLGQFYGVGDGAILREMQETVNNLTDELQVAARFSSQARTYADPSTQMDGDQLTSDPSDIVWCKDPRNNIYTVQGMGISPVVSQMIEFLLREAMKATRFHESMTGNQQGVTATATQISTQLAQGSVGIRDKKTDLAEVMGWADMYALKLCMEFWDKPFWASLSEKVSEWVDTESITSVPAMIPMTPQTADEYISSNKGSKGSKTLRIPEYEIAKDDSGNPIYSELEFSTDVIIGESIPKGRTDMYNIMLGLSQMMVVNKDGSQAPLISGDKVRAMMEEILGMKLRTEEEERDSMIGNMINPMVQNQLNPIGQGNATQVPTATPSNLQQTVPQMPQGDSRRVQL